MNMMAGNVTAGDFLPCTLPYEITSEQWSWYKEYSWWMEGFGSILIGSIGILLNITTIVVLLGTFLGASFFNWLLVFLALFDSMFLLNGILEAFRNHIGHAPYYHHYIFVIFLYPFRSVVLFCSMYMTVILALERYNALARPISHQMPMIGGNRKPTLISHFKMHWLRLIKYVGPIILFSTLFYAPKYMELYLEKNEECDTAMANYNCSEYVVRITELRKSNDYVMWYLNVTNLIVTTVIPLIALAFLNFNVYRKFKQYIYRQPSSNRRPALQVFNNVQEKSRKRERDVVQQTMILFVIVILFVLSHVIRVVLNIDELKSLGEERNALERGCNWMKFWTIIVAPISHTLLQINSGINFFIYCLFNPAFREVLLSKLCSVFNACKCRQTINQSIKDQEKPFHENYSRGTVFTKDGNNGDLRLTLHEQGCKKTSMRESTNI